MELIFKMTVFTHKYKLNLYFGTPTPKKYLGEYLLFNKCYPKNPTYTLKNYEFIPTNNTYSFSIPTKIRKCNLKLLIRRCGLTRLSDIKNGTCTHQNIEGLIEITIFNLMIILTIKESV